MSGLSEGNASGEALAPAAEDAGPVPSALVAEIEGTAAETADTLVEEPLPEAEAEDAGPVPSALVAEIEGLGAEAAVSAGETADAPIEGVPADDAGPPTGPIADQSDLVLLEPEGAPAPDAGEGLEEMTDAGAAPGIEVKPEEPPGEHEP